MYHLFGDLILWQLENDKCIATMYRIYIFVHKIGGFSKKRHFPLEFLNIIRIFASLKQEPTGRSAEAQKAER